MTYYLFYQPGHIPGRPGAYNNCRVDIDEEGNVTQSPLPVPPQDMATARQEEQAAQETPESLSAPATPPVEPIQEPPEPIQADVPPLEVPPDAEPVQGHPPQEPPEPVQTEQPTEQPAPPPETAE